MKHPAGRRVVTDRLQQCRCASPELPVVASWRLLLNEVCRRECYDQYESEPGYLTLYKFNPQCRDISVYINNVPVMTMSACLVVPLFGRGSRIFNIPDEATSKLLSAMAGCVPRQVVVTSLI